MKCRFYLVALFAVSYSLIQAQDLTSSKFGKGITILAQDSSFSMKFSTRIQTLYEGSYNTKTKDWSDKTLIRRARLKFDGYAFTPKLVYKIELSISNRDQGGILDEAGNSVNLIRDAVLKYKFAPGWELWFGQTKLPGNRERVISSQKLQFVDRSRMNSYFNLDRDSGIQLRNKLNFGNVQLRNIFSISMGEGQNILNNYGGHDYTYRLEVLPFGEFASNGDYFGSDLKREDSPKLSLGFVYDYNDDASRQRGQLGGFMLDENGNRIYSDLSSIHADAMFKYNGIQFMAEYANRKNLDENIALLGGGDWKGFYSGMGYVTQLGYLFKNNIELAGRFTHVEPDDITISSLPGADEYTFGLSKYWVEHSLKLQSDLSYIDAVTSDNTLRFRLQVELSF